MINTVIIQGRLGKDAEILKTKEGSPYSRFSIACSKSWPDSDGEWRQTTDWIPVVTFQKGLVEKVLRQKAVKGAHVLVEGELTGFDYTDQNNIRRVGIEVTIGRDGTIQFIPGGGVAGIPREGDGEDQDQEHAKAAGDEEGGG